MPITFVAHKDEVKTRWLNEIRHYVADQVALQEHATDDLRIDPNQVQQFDEVLRLPQRIEASDSDAGIRPSDVAKDYFLTKKKGEKLETHTTVTSSSVTQSSNQSVVQEISEVKESVQIVASQQVSATTSEIRSENIVEKKLRKGVAIVESVSSEESVKESSAEKHKLTSGEEPPSKVTKVEESDKKGDRVSRIPVKTTSPEKSSKQQTATDESIIKQQQEETKKREENQQREEEEKRKLEQIKLEEVKRQEEEQRKVEESKKREEQKRKIEEEKRVEEEKERKRLEEDKERKRLEEVKVQEETKKKEEEKRKKEEDKRKAEEELQRQEAAKRKDEELKKEQEKVKVEEEKKRAQELKEKEESKRKKDEQDRKEKEEEEIAKRQEDLQKQQELRKQKEEEEERDRRSQEEFERTVQIKNQENIRKLQESEQQEKVQATVSVKVESETTTTTVVTSKTEKPKLTVTFDQAAGGSQQRQSAKADKSPEYTKSVPFEKVASKPIEDPDPPDRKPPQRNNNGNHPPTIIPDFNPPPPLVYHTTFELSLHKEPLPPPPVPPIISHKIVVHTESLEQKTEDFLRGKVELDAINYSLESAQSKIKDIKSTFGKSKKESEQVEDTVRKAKSGEFEKISHPVFDTPRPKVFDVVEIVRQPGECDKLPEELQKKYDITKELLLTKGETKMSSSSSSYHATSSREGNYLGANDFRE